MRCYRRLSCKALILSFWRCVNDCLCLLQPGWLLAMPPLQAVIDLGPDFQPSCMVHPDTYINKVLIGGTDGTLQLWNYKTQQLVHSFKGW